MGESKYNREKGRRSEGREKKRKLVWAQRSARPV